MPEAKLQIFVAAAWPTHVNGGVFVVAWWNGTLGDKYELSTLSLVRSGDQGVIQR